MHSCIHLSIHHPSIHSSIYPYIHFPTRIHGGSSLLCNLCHGVCVCGVICPQRVVQVFSPHWVLRCKLHPQCVGCEWCCYSVESGPEQCCSFLCLCQETRKNINDKKKKNDVFVWCSIPESLENFVELTCLNSSSPRGLKCQSTVARAGTSSRLLQEMQPSRNPCPATASVRESTSEQPAWHWDTAERGRGEEEVGEEI